MSEPKKERPVVPEGVTEYVRRVRWMQMTKVS